MEPRKGFEKGRTLMKEAALFQRRAAFVVVVSTLVVSGCTGTFSGSGSNLDKTTIDRSTSAAALEGTQPTAAMGNQIALGSRTLMNSATDSIGLALTQTTDGSQVIVETAGELPKYEVTELHSPERLVIDLLGHPNTSTRTFETPESSVLSGVRIGSHADKSRIVLDLPTGATVTHQVDQRDGKLVLSLSGAAVARDSAAQETLARSAPEPTIPDASADRGGAVTPAEATLDSQFALTDSPSTTQSASNVLNSLQIALDGAHGNMVVAELSNPAQVSLKKTAQSEYVATIKGFRPDTESVQTVLAPPGSGLIRSARPVMQGSDLLLRIFAQPGTDLTARVNGNNLTIRSTNDADLAEKLMAQPKLDATGAPVITEPAKPSAPEAAKDGATAGSKPAAGGNAPAATDAAPSELAQLLGGNERYSGRLISLDLQDTDIDNALRIIAEVSNLNIIASGEVTGKVTLRLIDVPWDQALDVILKTNGLDKVQEGNVIRIAPIDKLKAEREALKQAQQAEEELEPLVVKYIRVSYAKAAELKQIVDTVISERGSTAYDERTNQLIIKDISKGIKNVGELVSKLDLRTPQVLLETQIVEASRSLSRDLGSELGFSMVQSPETGNATGSNFPNAITFGGSVDPASGITGSAFPVGVSPTEGSAVALLFDSADGTQTLSMRLSALEKEGRARVVSRPSVATTNNKEAVIESTKEIQVKLPSGGLSVATGQGATTQDSNSATQSIKAGILLKVTPQASPDYYVLLDIAAESSSFNFNETTDGIPSKIKRNASSTVLVSSGQTFAMGGIYRLTDTDSVKGVPFLKDVPVLGHLFRSAGVNNADEELLFFITPRIVEGSFDDGAMRVTQS